MNINNIREAEKILDSIETMEERIKLLEKVKGLNPILYVHDTGESMRHRPIDLGKEFTVFAIDSKIRDYKHQIFCLKIKIENL